MAKKKSGAVTTPSSSPVRLTLIAAAPQDADIAGFIARLNERFGAVASTHKSTVSSFSVDLDVAAVDELVTAAEKGVLDEELARSGGKWVQALVVRDEHVYDYLPQVEPSPAPPVVDVDADELREWKESIDLVLMTTTPVETEALYEVFTPMPGTSGLLEGALEHATYRIGRFGRYCAAHVECTMGSEGRDGAMLTIRDAVLELAPKAVVVVGIAFGVNRVKQRLGDVLVAETVEPYELVRVGKEVSVHRSQPLPCGRVLSERFRTRRRGWKFPRGLDDVKVQAGVVLSGAKVIDSVEFRDGLLAEYPTALGGEMEASGAYAAAHRASVEVVVVKAICDWADGLKNDRAQPFAARSAVSLAYYVLSKKDVLKTLGALEVPLGVRGVEVTASPAIGGDGPAIVGRRVELDYLKAVCQPDVAARAEPALTVFVQGIHGIGKTRLVREFAKQVSELDGRPISYVDFQAEECVDAPWAKELFPRGPRDEQLFRRLWGINEILGKLERERLVIFDELEALLEHMDESALLRFLQRACFYRKGPVAIFVVRKNWPAREGKLAGSPRLYIKPYVIVKPLPSEEGRALARQLMGDVLPANVAERLARELDALSGGIPFLITRWAEVVRGSPGETEELSPQSLRQRLMGVAESYFWASWDGMEKKEKLENVRRVVEGLKVARDLVQSSPKVDAKFSRLRRDQPRLPPAFAWFVATEIGAPEHLSVKPEPKQVRMLLAQAYELATAMGDLSRLVEVDF